VTARASLPLSWHRGQLHVPAAVVTDLLRGVGDQWLAWISDGATDLDLETVEALRASLYEIADQVDAECIGLTPPDPAADGYHR
jgi:hypothetical protein